MKTIPIKIFFGLALLFLTSILGACAHWLPEAHHIEIQQGNVIKQSERDALKSGISKKDVESLLGKAILRDPYHPNRWDYIYRIRSESKQDRISRLTLFFEDDKLITIDDSAFNPED